MFYRHCFRFLLINKQVHHIEKLSKCRFSSTNKMVKQTGVTFNGFMDRFNGVFVELSNEDSGQLFPIKLKESLEKWKNDNKRCIWFKISTRNSHCIPMLVEKGFDFHHARKEFVMMYKWLPEDSEPNLPPPCYTNLGVGAMVFNSKQQILAVSEKSYDYPHWKLPGGYVEMGEDIVDAAIREVKEETGVISAFQSLVTFRHAHNTMFGNSDIYVLLMMKAISEKIQKSDREVNDCKWMSVEEYTTHEHVHELNRLVVQKALEYKKKGIKLDIKKKTIKWAKYVREMNYLIMEEGNYD